MNNLKISLEFDRDGREKHHEIKITDLKEAISQAKQMLALSDVYSDPNGNGKKYWSTVLEKLNKL